MELVCGVWYSTCTFNTQPATAHAVWEWVVPPGTLGPHHHSVTMTADVHHTHVLYRCCLQP
jgi:hypothetical protein